MKTKKIWAAAVGLMALTATAQALPVFQGRLANGAASTTCTVSGAGKCTSYYDSALDITILNNWNIGQGFWSATAAAGSAQALAEAAGFAATGLTGWVLPTSQGFQPDGPLHQYHTIWRDAGRSLAALQAQFDGVQAGNYASSSLDAASPFVWYFLTDNGGTGLGGLTDLRFAVAVRPGDVAAVPEPQTWAMLLMGFSALGVAWKRRRA